MKDNVSKGIADAGSGLFVELRANPWIVSTIFLVVILVGVIVLGGVFGIGDGNVSKDKAAENLISFIDAQGNGNAELVSAEKSGSLYKVTVKYNERDIPVYVTLDGQYLVSSTIPLTAFASSDTGNEQTPDNSQPAAQEIPKSDKPKVELFVMTYCPYGTQAEKGIIPAIKALGSKIDAKIRFVHYFMHGDTEEQETYNQVCIREEQSAKFWNYLECFLEAGDSAGCLTKTAIDKTKLSACTGASGKAKEYYAKDSELSKQYGVQGSPALIINGAKSVAGRSSASYLSGICGAFNKAPSSECGKQLSSATPGAGFGTASSGGSGAGGGCASA